MADLDQDIEVSLLTIDCSDFGYLPGRQRSEPRSPAVQGSAWELPGGVPLRYAPLEQTCS